MRRDDVSRNFDGNSRNSMTKKLSYNKNNLNSSQFLIGWNADRE